MKLAIYVFLFFFFYSQDFLYFAFFPPFLQFPYSKGQINPSRPVHLTKFILK